MIRRVADRLAGRLGGRLGGHVPPHRWADANAGRLGARALRAIEDHAAGCERCAAERDRVERACDALDSLREGEVHAPALAWDHIGARIYWVTSSEQRATRRETARERRAAWAWIAIPAAACAVIAGGWWLAASRHGPAPRADHTREATADSAVRAPDTAATRADATEPAPLAGVITLASGEIRADGAALPGSALDRAIGPGARIETGDGRIAVQLGDKTGFHLGPRSAATLRAFDDARVEIEVEGEIAVTVAPRAPGQVFRVIAGAHAVEVRGTAFRVTHRDGGVRVACSHGRVVVSAGDIARVVDAMQWLAVEPGDELDLARLEPMDPGDAEALEGAVRLLPLWTGADAAREASAILDVRAPLGQSVKVDGEIVGRGAFALRLTPGRHQVQSEGGDGWTRGEWIALEARATRLAQVAPAPPAPAPRAGSRGDRIRGEQLASAVRRTGAIAGCLRSLRKQGLANAPFISLELGVNRDGSIGYNNVRGHNLTDSAARCIRDAIDHIQFPPGPRADLRQRLTF